VSTTTTAFASGMFLSLSLIVAIGPQNAHVLRMGLLRSHVGITVLACAVTDVILIALGVAGLAQLGKLSPLVMGAMIGAASLFLAHYGLSAAQRAWRNQYSGLQAAHEGAPRSRTHALSAALATRPDNLVFGAGAAAGSAVWFVGLGMGAQLLAHKLARPAVWRVIDASVALTMWGTAAWLLMGLLR
jgi:L-lysine exporter family protein LysE/ArgO